MSKAKPNILEIEGMSCSSCAAGVKKIIERKGGQSVDVNFGLGKATFEANEEQLPNIIESINQGGFSVVNGNEKRNWKISPIEWRLIISSLFTMPLIVHMFLPRQHLLNDAVVQLSLTIPVLIFGGIHFFKSAWNSLKIGVPNMDVLVSTGVSSALIYSLYGTLSYYGTEQVHQFLFFETAATIITLVLLGNVIEQRSVKQTTNSIRELEQLKTKYVTILTPFGSQKIELSELKVGDFIFINQGDTIPLDGELSAGSITCDESLISGESAPVVKKVNDQLIAGSVCLSGSSTMKISTVDGHSTIDHIIQLVESAQSDKPGIQRLGDKISAVFVPAVLTLAIVAFLISYAFLNVTFSESLLSAIAVLVISCPCAMGLAAPTAVMVAIGRAAKKGVLIKGGATIERIAECKTVILDKTGTLTDGAFSVLKIEAKNRDLTEIEAILQALCIHSSHPISKSIIKHLSEKNIKPALLKNIKEIKGEGIQATLKNEPIFLRRNFGEGTITKSRDSADIVLELDKKILASIWIGDQIKPEAKAFVNALNSRGFRTIMLSGDRESKCQEVANLLGIKEVYAEKSPEIKLDLVKSFQSQGKCIMVGDGINDAPALTLSSVGISFEDATGIAKSSADIVLLDSNLNSLTETIALCHATYKTIKQNFFWAFFYNVLAIPVAGLGYLSPMLAALSMAFSDVIVIGNSLLLRKKVLR